MIFLFKYSGRLKNKSRANVEKYFIYSIDMQTSPESHTGRVCHVSQDLHDMSPQKL